MRTVAPSEGGGKKGLRGLGGSPSLVKTKRKKKTRRGHFYIWSVCAPPGCLLRLEFIKCLRIFFFWSWAMSCITNGSLHLKLDPIGSQIGTWKCVHVCVRVCVCERLRQMRLKGAVETRRKSHFAFGTARGLAAGRSDSIWSHRINRRGFDAYC